MSIFENTRSRRRISALSPQSVSQQENVQGITWLSTSIVHDLRNPLGAIYAAAEILIDLDAPTTQVQRLATNIFRAAVRMRELLANLNSVALGNTPTAEICDIGEVISEASNAVWPATDSRSVQIVIAVPHGIELPLIRPRMQSVFANLIANALEAMPTGGRLHITAREANTCVLIEMEDSGPGIPPAVRGRLFEPFATAGKQYGLGLGLAVARQTVLDHGGDIWVEPAAGARFVVRLPLHQQQGPNEQNMLRKNKTSSPLARGT
ncbi:MAG TPA: HAMP domain-containing sensor histidine kinase [Terriglobales bacterium]|nr:HAMP domain-containing sensor histidine kinase [Terriglobales bacterium]